VAQFARGMCLHDDDLAADFLCFVFSVSFPVLLQLCSSVPFAFRRVFFCFIQPPVVYKKCKRIYIDLIRMRTGERAGDRADLGGGKEREREKERGQRLSETRSVEVEVEKKLSSLSLSPHFFLLSFSCKRARPVCSFKRATHNKRPWALTRSVSGALRAGECASRRRAGGPRAGRGRWRLLLSLFDLERGCERSSPAIAATFAPWAFRFLVSFCDQCTKEAFESPAAPQDVSIRCRNSERRGPRRLANHRAAAARRSLANHRHCRLVALSLALLAPQRSLSPGLPILSPKVLFSSLSKLKKPCLKNTQYVEELWKRKQSDVMRFLLRVRCWEYRQLPGLVRLTGPSRPDKVREDRIGLEEREKEKRERERERKKEKREREEGRERGRKS